MARRWKRSRRDGPVVSTGSPPSRMDILAGNSLIRAFAFFGVNAIALGIIKLFNDFVLPAFPPDLRVGVLLSMMYVLVALFIWKLLSGKWLP